MDRTDAVRPDPPGVERTGTERVEELEERLVLLAQDLVNVRRRRDEDVERAVARERELLLCGWLAIVDDLERALASREATVESLREGLSSVVREARRLLESWGVTRIDALGRAFDPRMHEAVGLSDEGAAGRVLAEVRPGYLIGSDVLRPAAVLVGREPGP